MERAAMQRAMTEATRARAAAPAVWLLAWSALAAAGCTSIVDQFRFAAVDASADGTAADADGADVGDGLDAADAAGGVSDAGGDGGVSDDADSGVDASDGSPDADADADVDAADGVETSTATPECATAADCGKTIDACTFYVCLGQLCVLKAEKDGVSCDDGFACSSGDACAAGLCTTSNTKGCGCWADADCKAVDADLCAGAPYCDKSGAAPVCKINPATVVQCSKANDSACQVNTCDKATGTCALALVKPTAGAFAVLCEDGNPCTVQDACDKGVCVAGPSVCGCTTHADCKGKGDACTGELYCDLLAASPKCVPNPLNVKVCTDDGGPCAVVACDAKTGACKATAKTENAPCDDGNPCTSDSCVGGVCTPGVGKCGCKSDGECAKFEDGDLCNGVYYCDKADPKGPSCKVNPATVVVCDQKADSACQQATCAKATGACSAKYADKFSPCNADGDPCTEKDSCDGKGACLAGTNTCGCSSDADCKGKEDGDLCTGTLYCDTSTLPAVCKVNPKTVVICSDPNQKACHQAVCAPKTGACSVVAVADFTPCDDGKPCTKGDDCQGGACKAGTDFCACTTDTDCIGDGNLCNGIEFCAKGPSGSSCQPKPGSAIKCSGGPGGGGCQALACVPSTGLCAPTPDATACDDGNPCTADICDSAGKCAYAPVAEASACALTGGGGGICAAKACVAAVPGMVWIGGGDGYLGCKPGDAKCATDEGEQTAVKLDGFWFDRLEVSVADWAACMAAGLCSAEPGTDDAGCNWKVPGRAKHPVNCVSHAQASAYCNAQGKRLPTEAEWERAARGGCAVISGECASGTPLFPWGDALPTCELALMMGETKPGCDLGVTAAVGSWPKDESPYGVRDLAGNVAEWTVDGYVAAKWLGQPLTNPKTEGTGARVVRGGHLSSTPAQVRATRRGSQPPSVALPTLGFRCARTKP